MSLSKAHKAAFRREVVHDGRVFAIRDGQGYPAPSDPEGRRAVPFWSKPTRARRVVDQAAAFLGFEIVVIELDALPGRAEAEDAVDPALLQVADERGDRIDVQGVPAVAERRHRGCEQWTVHRGCEHTVRCADAANFPARRSWSSSAAGSSGPQPPSSPPVPDFACWWSSADPRCAR